MADIWLGPTGFYRFYIWAILNGYDPSLSLSRKDMSLPYSPQNCIWIKQMNIAPSMLGKHLTETAKAKIGALTSKPLKCVETGETYRSARDAARKTGVSLTGISKCIGGKLKTAGKRRWQRLEGAELLLYRLHED